MASTKPSTISPLCIYLQTNLHLKRGFLLPISHLPSTKTISIRLRTEFYGDKDANLARQLRKQRLVLVRANGGFNFNSNGGGGGWDKATTRRLIGNLAFAAGLTYLSVTGQLGWVIDAIVSIWVLAVILPIVGIAAFFYFAGQDIVQSSCPNCGNDFQIFKSSLTDGPQLCPFCSQPFSVEDDKFVRESARFSSEKSPRFTEAFNGFSSRVSQEKATTASTTVVDIEAEVKDAD
ncbi:hypothetical protein LUZ61_016205 [Rhynchospora tenuis]|uniref:Uncharacterized protein n=1 Tax=Rhynchospora tenuis TaxID=198213 RepID=A0AAD5Z543_9POAL|nr:hypothetical protein LUZ61_016205 [Rhynchospora tenuis]